MFAAAVVRDKQLKEEQVRREQEALLAQQSSTTQASNKLGSNGKVGLSDLFSSSPIPIVERTNTAIARQNVLKPLPATSLNRATTTARAGLDIKSAMTTKPPAPRMGELQRQESMNRMTQLHASVDFDENDFVDDADIDLDGDFGAPKPVSYPKLPPLNDTPTYPSKNGSFTSAKAAITSSAPVPWSSSPLSHKLANTDVRPFKKPRLGIETLSAVKAPISGSQAAPVELESSDDEVFAAPPKRRMLPWQQTGGVTTIAPGSRPSTQSETSFETAKTSHSPQLPVSATPAAKSTNPAYAWNTSVSAVKAQQKKLRTKTVQPKASVTTTEPDVDKNDTTQIMSTDNKVWRVFLSHEQRKVLDLVVEGKKSVFFTGSAGTGKSVLMRQIIAALKSKYKHEADRVAVAASTGLAACNIGGVTLHSFAGIGLGKETVEELVKKIKKNPKTKHRWLRTKVLIIDEISMVDGATFDKLEQIARRIRNNGMTWGGIQLVVTGDFFQLPPVPDGMRVAKFAFEANTWQTAIDHTIGLTQVFRQKDPVFANMLNEMRLGKLTTESIATFKRLSRRLEEQDGITATELFPTRDEVDRANRIRLSKLNGKDFEFTAFDSGRAEPAQRERILSACMAPQTLKLRKGAQVMLIKNIDETLVNGSIGKVVGFMDEMMFTRYDEQDHGSSDPLAESDEEDKPLMRPSLSGLSDKYAHGGTLPVWPLVRFQIPDGTTRDLLCHRESWTYELPNGEVQAERAQVPLIMAWALSIHKAQGQTLPRVIVDLNKIFEKGQAYVALSRATSQEGLQVLNFNPAKVQAHDKVKVFYNSLYAAGTIGKDITVKAEA